MGGLIISYLIGDFAEDFFFDDIGKWGGIWHSWGTFVAPLSMILAGVVCNHFWIQFNNPLGALRHNSGIRFSLSHGNTPLKWPATKFDKASDENYAAILVSNAIYAYINLYYAVQWKLGIFKPKVKLPDAEKLIEMTLENQQISPEE